MTLARKVSQHVKTALFIIALTGTSMAIPAQLLRKPGEKQPAATILPGASRPDIYVPVLRKKSVAVFANQTSMVGRLHLVDTLMKRGIRIRRIFAPEHGFRGDADAGENIRNMTDAATGIPVVSLYGNKTKPSAEDLRDIDVMLFDIQDVGVRFYTYISSLQQYMEAATENDKPLIILDRPNPNGFYVDGPVLDTAYRSFVGMQPVPIVYGMTIGEYARMLLGEKRLPVKSPAARVLVCNRPSDLPSQKSLRHFQLIIVPVNNYTHQTRYKLPVQPSPNLPNMQAVYLYPSLCFFEGTPISLGRGTDKPFQQFGHPDFPHTLYSFTPESRPGAKNPPLRDRVCYGYDLSGSDLNDGKHNRLQLQWLLKAYEMFPDKKQFFLATDYFSKLAGNGQLREQITEGKTEEEIRKSWQPGLERFMQTRKKYLIYPDFE